jgi:peptidoglycan hydrolase CwlO-like protein
MNETIILFITNTLTFIIAWVFGKRKNDADTDNLILKNLQVSIDIYREIIGDLQKEIENLNIKIQELERKIDVLHEENIKLKQYGKGI